MLIVVTWDLTMDLHTDRRVCFIFSAVIQICSETAKDPIKYSAKPDHQKVKSGHISLLSSFPLRFSENCPPPKKWEHFSIFTSPDFRFPSIILYKCSIFWLQLRSNYDILSYSLLRIPLRYNQTTVLIALIVVLWYIYIYIHVVYIYIYIYIYI